MSQPATDRPAGVAWPPVALAVLTLAALLTALSPRYGYHRDELHFRLLPPAGGYLDRARAADPAVAVLASNHGEAGAFDRFTRHRPSLRHLD